MLFMLLNILPHFLLQNLFSYFPPLKPRCVLWSEKYGNSLTYFTLCKLRFTGCGLTGGSDTHPEVKEPRLPTLVHPTPTGHPSEGGRGSSTLKHSELPE